MAAYKEGSYCGIDCGKCKNYKKNLNCQGCKAEKELISDCPTRSCAAVRGLSSCGVCMDFPCKTLSDFYHDGNPLHRQAEKNMLAMIQDGVKH